MMAGTPSKSTTARTHRSPSWRKNRSRCGRGSRSSLSGLTNGAIDEVEVSDRWMFFEDLRADERGQNDLDAVGCPRAQYDLDDVHRCRSGEHRPAAHHGEPQGISHRVSARRCGSRPAHRSSVGSACRRASASMSALTSARGPACGPGDTVDASAPAGESVSEPVTRRYRVRCFSGPSAATSSACDGGVQPPHHGRQDENDPRGQKHDEAPECRCLFTGARSFGAPSGAAGRCDDFDDRHDHYEDEQPTKRGGDARGPAPPRHASVSALASYGLRWLSP